MSDLLTAHLAALAAFDRWNAATKPKLLTPAESFERRLRANCPGAWAEAEREEYIAEHGEEPPEDDDYEPPPWEE